MIHEIINNELSIETSPFNLDRKLDTLKDPLPDPLPNTSFIRVVANSHKSIIFLEVYKKYEMPKKCGFPH